MKKRSRSLPIAALSILLVILLAGTIWVTIQQVNSKMMRYCFDDLQAAAGSLATEVRQMVESDRAMLTTLAALLAERDMMNPAELAPFLSAYRASTPYISNVEILYPDQRLLRETGEVVDASDWLDFQQESEKGAYVSDKSESLFMDGAHVLRNAVPVLRDGETVAMLYGVIMLSELPERFNTYLYEGNAYVYIIDGNNGDMLLDTWHKELSSISKLGQRPMLPGYSFEQTQSNVQNGISGELAIVSNTTGETMYMHYEPIGVNNWSIALTVTESEAFYNTRSISSLLYIMVAITSTLVLAYMLYVICSIRRNYRTIRKLVIEDQTTGALNRNAYETFANTHQDTVYASIACLYADANGLHELNNVQGHEAGDRLLRAVADCLQQKFGAENVYRMGGDEFIALCPDKSREDVEKLTEECIQRLQEQDYSVSIGLAWCENERGLKRITQEADADMLARKGEYYKTHDRRRRG